MKPHPAVPYGGEVTIMNAKSIFGHQKLMAMAVVAMFAMCALSVCLVADSDAGPYGGVTVDNDSGTDGRYSIDVSVGQHFIYSNIKTNLDGIDGTEGTISITGSGNDSQLATFGNPVKGTDSWTLEGDFLKAGTYVYTMTAEWTFTPDDANQTTLTQTAKQTLTFNIKERISISEDNGYGYAVLNETAQPIILGYSGTTDYEPKLSGTDGLSFDVKFNDTGDKIIITPKENVNKTIGSYNFSVSVTNTASKDADSADLIYRVFEKIVVEDVKEYTYEGNEDTSGDVKMNVTWEATSGNPAGTIDSYTFVFDPLGNTVLTESTSSPGNGTVNRNVTISKPGEITGTGTTETSKTFTATLTVKGTVPATTGGTTQETSSEGTYTLVVYKALAFMSKPEIGDTKTVTISNTANNVILSSYIKGAKIVSINWGDGTSVDSQDGQIEGTYNAYHSYAKSGMYSITISATNDFGTTTSQVLYNVDDGNIEIPTDPENPSDDSGKSFFDKHGYQFLIFAILAILLLVAFFFLGFQNPMVIILAVVMIVLAVLCYVCNDIGGIVEAIKGPLGKA